MRKETITCGLSGVMTEPDTSHNIEDLDLPAGWVELTFRKVVPNPSYAKAIMQAAQALHAQQFGDKKLAKGEERPTVEQFADQLAAQPELVPSLPEPFELVEYTEEVCPEAAAAVLAALTALGLNFADFVEGGAE